MKKLLGVLFALVMVFALSTNVNAKTLSFSQIREKALELAAADGIVPTITESGSTINIEYSGSTLTLSYKNGVVEYTTYSSIGYTGLKYIVNAVAQLQGKDLTFDDIFANLSSRVYCENNISGTLTDDGEDIATLKFDTNKFGTNTCGGSGDSSSSTNTSTSNKQASTNPKTGVFVPVVGISVLIVASVVCLLWISKKNIYKGF